MNNNLCVMIDGNSLMYRAFHSMPDTLTSPAGKPVGAMYGFMLMLMKLMTEHKPAMLCVAFDTHGPTRRHIQYEEYKANRPPTPDLLRPQFEMVREALRDMGVAILIQQGFEADDLLGTLSLECEKRGFRSLIVTGDRDSFQLICETTSVLFTKKGVTDTLLLNSDESLVELMQITPAQIPDYKGLAGDSSDNIPGIPGVGDKTAVKLLTEFDTLENVLANAETQKGKLRERLIEHADLARKCKLLATIDRDVPAPIDFDALTAPDTAMWRDVFLRYGFKSLAGRVSKDLVKDDRTGEIPVGAAPRVARGLQRSPVYIDNCSALRALAAAITQPVALHIADRLTLADDARLWRANLLRDLSGEGIQLEDALDALSALFAKPELLILWDAKKLMRCFKGTPLADVLLESYVECETPDIKDAAELYDQYCRGESLTRPNASTLRATEAVAPTTINSSLYKEVELPLTRVLFDMEQAGFLVDTGELMRIGIDLREREAILRENIFGELGGKPFNLASPKQLGKVLFEDMKLATGRKTKGGAYSTDSHVLEPLAETVPVVASILEWRRITKLIGTYIEGIQSKIASDGRVHSVFDQTAAITGRISSSEPNLQNIPTRTEQGRELRRAFIAPEGYTLIDADYSQIELRILAHLAQDPIMIETFMQGGDIHLRTAAQVAGVPLSKVTHEMRSAAKAVNFGIVYGQTDYGLSQGLGISRKDASDFIEGYFRHYPKIKEYLDSSVAFAKEHGYAETIMNRKRMIPELESANRNTRMFGERAAMNTPVQGSAADIIKLAMVRVANALHGMKSRLILQVHDELIVETHLGEVSKVKKLLAREMENAASLSVPLKVDLGEGRSWYECK
ncbi:MAG: DNA polymerase I [Oscillospiraceae bacterium]|jgi:DNA polymerase-1|nr:DNA polymerase I [Oscillospiraceae bacterium]